MTRIFCQKGNEKSGLTPLQKKTASPLLIDVGVNSSLLWITIVSKVEPQIIMATCLITEDDLMGWLAAQPTKIFNLLRFEDTGCAFMQNTTLQMFTPKVGNCYCYFSIKKTSN